MLYKLGFTFTIFFAACTCQEINPDAAQTSAAQTAAVISGTVLQADLRTPWKNAQVTATRGARPEHSDEVEDGSAAERKFSTKRMKKPVAPSLNAGPRNSQR